MARRPNWISPAAAARHGLSFRNCWRAWCCWRCASAITSRSDAARTDFRRLDGRTGRVRHGVASATAVRSGGRFLLALLWWRADNSSGGGAAVEPDCASANARRGCWAGAGVASLCSRPAHATRPGTAMGNGVIDDIQDTLELMDDSEAEAISAGRRHDLSPGRGRRNTTSQTWAQALPEFLRWALPPRADLAAGVRDPHAAAVRQRPERRDDHADEIAGFTTGSSVMSAVVQPGGAPAVARLGHEHVRHDPAGLTPCAAVCPRSSFS